MSSCYNCLAMRDFSVCKSLVIFFSCSSFNLASSISAFSSWCDTLSYLRSFTIWAMRSSYYFSLLEVSLIYYSKLFFYAMRDSLSRLLAPMVYSCCRFLALASAHWSSSFLIRFVLSAFLVINAPFSASSWSARCSFSCIIFFFVSIVSSQP